MRPLEPWDQDGSALHLAQQGEQPVCELEEGVQGDLLAGGYHPVFPVGEASQGVHDRAAMLPRTGKTSEGQALRDRSVLHQTG